MTEDTPVVSIPTTHTVTVPTTGRREINAQLALSGSSPTTGAPGANVPATSTGGVPAVTTAPPSTTSPSTAPQNRTNAATSTGNVPAVTTAPPTTTVAHSTTSAPRSEQQHATSTVPPPEPTVPTLAPKKVKALQHYLTCLGYGVLIENGVYDEKTHEAWLKFLNDLATGALPSIAWVENIEVRNNAIINRFASKNVKKGFQYLRLDTSHGARRGLYRGIGRTIDYDHINVDFPKTDITGIKSLEEAKTVAQKIKFLYNHHPIDNQAHRHLRNFENAAKKVQIGGRILLVGGIALDALELGIAINEEVARTGRMGKNTLRTTARIGGRWAGAIAGVKTGAAGGAKIGSVVPGTGNIIGCIAGAVILGIAGSFTGGKLAEYVVDVTVAECEICGKIIR